MAESHIEESHDEHPTTTIRQYLLIGLILSVITAVELVMSLYAVSYTHLTLPTKA